MEKYCQLIKQQYEDSTGDSSELFQTIMSVADEIGLDSALAYLEQCVIEKRLSWLDRNQTIIHKTGNPVFDGYRAFYEIYLGVSVPKDGKIVEQTNGKLVIRWWNHCPTLEACKQFGLDTREVCRKTYHQPVQAFLSKIDPRLKFERNYDALRPQVNYCEEIIILEE